MYNQCPNNCCDVTLFESRFDDEENAVIYRCWACDWEEIERNPFHIGAWSVRLSQALAPIDIFQSFLADEEAVRFLKPRLRGESYLAKFVDFDKGEEFLRGEIDIANQIYLRQMVVLAATYIELILKDFFGSFTQANPSSLIENYLRKNDKRGRFRERAMRAVNIENVLDGTAKKELIDEFFRMGEKDHWDIIKDYAQQCAIRLDRRELFGKIEELKKLRNDIAHNNLYNEIGGEQIGVQQVYESFKLINGLLYVLMKIADRNEIPYWARPDPDFEWE